MASPWACLGQPAGNVVCFCFSECSVLLLQQLCCYSCMYAAEFQVHCILRETAQGPVDLHMQYSESACSVRTGYAFFGTLVSLCNRFSATCTSDSLWMRLVSDMVPVFCKIRVPNLGYFQFLLSLLAQHLIEYPLLIVFIILHVVAVLFGTPWNHKQHKLSATGIKITRYTCTVVQGSVPMCMQVCANVRFKI